MSGSRPDSIRLVHAKSGDWIGWIFPDRVLHFMAELQAGALEKSLRRWKAGNNYDTVISQIQEYLDQGEYGKLFEYGEYYHLTDSEKGKFADYYNVFWCAWRYDRTAGDMDSYLRSQDYEDQSIRDSYLQSLADSLSSFIRRAGRISTRKRCAPSMRT